MIKVWNDFKKFSLKIFMCRFACTTYDEKFLELTNYEQGLPVEGLDVFLIKMETLGDTITDLTPPVSDTNMHEYEQRLTFGSSHSSFNGSRESRGTR